MDGRLRAALAVAARRGELGMTQQQLADTAGVDVKTIGNLESRGRWPIARTRARIEETLGWPPGEMERRRREDEGPPISPELRAMIDGLTPGQREYVMEQLTAADRRLRRREDPGSGSQYPRRQAAG